VSVTLLQQDAERASALLDKVFGAAAEDEDDSDDDHG
jgi:hypothetical protein